MTLYFDTQWKLSTATKMDLCIRLDTTCTCSAQWLRLNVGCTHCTGLQDT